MSTVRRRAAMMPVADSPRVQPSSMPTWPSTGLGRAALVVSIVALASIIVLPLITTLFGEIYPVTDTAVMPLIGTALLLTASVLDVVVVAMRRHRTVISIVVLVSVLAATLFIAPIVIGEVLGELL